MGLTRNEHWATRSFHDFLLAHKDVPFKWGENDCCMFAADAIKTITGTDIAADFRGRYNDADSAQSAIESIAGGKSVEDAAAYCAAKYGLVELHEPLLAKRGDLVLVDDPAQGTIAGVVHLNGRHIAVVGEKGLKARPIRHVKRAWRV